MTSPQISNVRFTSAHSPDASGGLLGFVAVTIGETWRIDCIALRRSAKGAVILSFPERRDSNGRRHPIVRPTDSAARAAITAAVLAALRLQILQPGTATCAAPQQVDSAR